MGWVRRTVLTLAVSAGLGLTLTLALSPAVASAQAMPPVTAADRSIGRADAPITVVEYASFACPHCADWHRFVYPLLKSRWIDTGKVRLVFRNLPTPPAEASMPAAGIARCAEPRRFFDVATALFQGQSRAMHGGSAEAWFDAAIAQSGRTEAQIDTCLSDRATLAAINADIRGANAMGVDSTPTLFVNGQMVSDHTLGGLETRFRALLEAD